ncbi:mechanosensitive ion channel family protein [Halobacteria archaeon HArc-gm2]|mgnify:CR=1 FL=1|nr:mechanosensitive ion channel family protein [Halobacteria archaeon HArc-gm2]
MPAGRSNGAFLGQVTATPTGTATGNTTETPESPVPVELFPDWFPYWAQDLLSALVVVALAFLVSRLFIKLFGRRIARRFERPSVTRTVIRGIRFTVFLFAFLTVLSIYDFGLGDIAIQVGVFTAVLGIVLAPIVGSVISGFFLLADQPYEIGDMIELDDTGQTGFVEDITLRYTKIFTLDNTFLVIPNGTMRERDVINYSAEDSRTRLELPVLVTYESDIPEARRLIQTAARQVDVVIQGGPDIRVGAARYPAAPTCYIDEFGDHGILLTLRYWIEQPYKLLATRSEVQTNVWEALADADVEIAYPHSHLYFDETSGQLGVGMDELSRNGPTGSSTMAHDVDGIDSPGDDVRSDERTDDAN